MQLNATLQDGPAWPSDGNQTVLLEPDYLQRGRWSRQQSAGRFRTR